MIHDAWSTLGGRSTRSDFYIKIFLVSFLPLFSKGKRRNELACFACYRETRTNSKRFGRHGFAKRGDPRIKLICPTLGERQTYYLVMRGNNRRGSVSVIDEEREQSCMKYDTETLGRVADDDDVRDQGRLKFYLFDRIRILLFFIRRIEISWAAWDRLGK